MPDQSSAATEHSILQEITAPLSTLPDDPVPIAAHVDFPIVLRGYDRLAVDAYVKKTSQLVAELQASRSPEAAVRRALERVGEQISGILQRAHETAEEITVQSRREAEDRLEQARQESAEVTVRSQARLGTDVETDRIWGERHRIVDDVRELSRQLVEFAEAAAKRFRPPRNPKARGWGVQGDGGGELETGETGEPAAPEARSARARRRKPGDSGASSRSARRTQQRRGSVAARGSRAAPRTNRKRRNVPRMRAIELMHLGRERVICCWQAGDVLIDPGPWSVPAHVARRARRQAPGRCSDAHPP